MRIPILPDNPSRKEVFRWCVEMQRWGLLYHFDDSPESIIKIGTDEPTLTFDECKVLNRYMNVLFNQAYDPFEYALKALRYCRIHKK